MNILKKLFEFISIILIGVGGIIVAFEFLITDFLFGLRAPISSSASWISILILVSGLLIRRIVKRN